MTLYQQLEQKVALGELTYQAILMEIHRIKKYSHLTGFLMCEKEDVILEKLEDQGTNPLELLMKKEAWDLLSDKTKKAAEIILNCGTISKTKIYKILRQSGLRRAEVLKIERELKQFSMELK
jgi:hypothetical protein